MLSVAGLFALLFTLGIFFGIPFLLLRSLRHHERLSQIDHQLRRLADRIDNVELAVSRTSGQSDTAGAAEAGRPQPVQSPEQQAPEQQEAAGQPTPPDDDVAGEPVGTPAPDSPHQNGVDADRAAAGPTASAQETGQAQETPAAQPEGTAPTGSLPPTDGNEPPAPPPWSPSESIEERLGTKWAVYLGGAAITFGGVFLVRHAIEVGLLGPTARVILGAMLGLILIGLGTRMRFRDVDVIYGAIGGAHVPSVLTSAGTVVLFASAYAAYGLYELIGVGTAFLLLGLIGLGTLAAALLHGPALAGLGLAGSLLTPLLVSASAPNPWALVIYLAVVTAAAYALARIRGWLWLAVAATAGAAAWAVLLATAGLAKELWHVPTMIHILVQTLLAALIVAVEPHIERRLQDAHPDRVATAVLGVMSAVTIFAVVLLPFQSDFLVPFALLAVAILAAAAYLAPSVAAAGAFAALVMAAVLIRWPAAELEPSSADYYGMFVHLIRLPTAVNSFLAVAGMTSIVLAGAATYQLWRRQELPVTTSAIVCISAVAPPLLALTLAYLRVTGFGTAISFTFIGIVLAAGFAVVADKFDRRAKDAASENWRYASGAFAAAAIAATAIAMVAGLQRGYLTVAFAVAVVGTAFIADRKQIPLLRYAAGALALVVLARVIWDPRIMGEDVGGLPILNWLLVGYGAPALCFAAASHYLRREREDVCSHLVDVLTILFVALLGIYQIRHFLYAGDPLAQQTGHVEMGLQAVLMIALSQGLARLLARRPGPVIDVLQWVAAGIGGAIIALGLGIAFNPAFTPEVVTGGVPFSSLVPAYLAPGLMALYVARHARGLRPDTYILAAAVLALALIFAYVTLETRHAFHGEDIRLRHGFEQPEMWALTVVWLLLAVTYLAYGLVRASVPARAASGILLAITIVKVGVFDLAGVTGLWRALSFICLGAVLIGIGIVYQKLIFQARRPQPPDEAEAVEASP